MNDKNSIDEATRLRNWLARESTQSVLDELDERFAQRESGTALLQQQAQMRLVRELLGSQPCSCRTFPNGARLVKCVSRKCKSKTQATKGD